MTLTHWLALSNVTLGIMLCAAIWFWWDARKEASENLVDLLQEGHENKRLSELVEKQEKTLRELRVSARSLEDLDDGLRVIVTDVDVLASGTPGACGSIISPGHRRRQVTFHLRTEERVHEAILASGEGRRFVVPVGDVISIESDGGLDW